VKKPAVRTLVQPSSATIDVPIADPLASRPAAGAQFYGSLAIDSTPVGARAFVNGKPVGVTPLVLMKVPVGSRAIRLEANNRLPWSSTVRVVADRRTRVSVMLSPSR